MVSASANTAVSAGIIEEITAPLRGGEMAVDTLRRGRFNARYGTCTKLAAD